MHCFEYVKHKLFFSVLLYLLYLINAVFQFIIQLATHFTPKPKIDHICFYLYPSNVIFSIFLIILIASVTSALAVY